jgi:hypothetical protein
MKNERKLPDYRVIEEFDKTLDQSKLTLSEHQSKASFFRPGSSRGQKFAEAIKNIQSNAKKF